MNRAIKIFGEAVSLVVLLLSFIAAAYILKSGWGGNGMVDKARNCMVWDNKTVYCGTLSDIIKSDDSGKSWKVISKNTNWWNVRRLFLTKSGKIFYARDNEGILWMANVSDDTHWKRALNTTYSNSTFWGMTEDKEGGIYVSEYNIVSSPYCDSDALIWKSGDNGTTWSIVYDSSSYGIGPALHIHFVAADPYTDYIYATQDTDGNSCGVKALIRSTDYGKTWTVLSRTNRSSYSTIQFTKDARILGEDAAFEGNGSIVRTVDDINFVPVLVLNGTLNANFYSSAKTANGALLFGTVVEMDGNNASIWISKDDGLSWKLKKVCPESKQWQGIYGISNPGETGVNYVYEKATPTKKTK